jgi:hypothetical protein
MDLLQMTMESHQSEQNQSTKNSFRNAGRQKAVRDTLPQMRDLNNTKRRLQVAHKVWEKRTRFPKL